MALKGFTFYRTYADVAEELSEKEQKEFYFAIIRYLMYDDDREEKLSKNVRIAFKCIKPNLKTSRSRAESGKNGMMNRYNKSLTNEQQTPNKTLTNEQQVQVQVQVKDKGRDVPSACPKCGGPLDWTAVTKPGKHGVRRMFSCPKCHEEVWSA